MSKIEIQVNRKRAAYDFLINGVEFNGFIEEETWNGMTKYRDSATGDIIIAQWASHIGELMLSVFGPKVVDKDSLRIISCSPSILERITANGKSGAEG